MGYNQGIILAPVNQYDVQRALGENTPDVATLCISENINKWAKYRPIRYPKIDDITVYDRQSVNYGIKDIPTWTRLAYMEQFLFTIPRPTDRTKWPQCDIDKGQLSLEYWVDDKPTGGMNAPCRITDFVEHPLVVGSLGYYHNAEAPVGNVANNAITIMPNGNMRIVFASGAQSNLTIKLSEMSWPNSSSISFSSMHFGIVAKKYNDAQHTSVYFGTQRIYDEDTQTWQEITMLEAEQYGYWVDVQPANVYDWFVGDWEIYPVISSYASPFVSLADVSGNFICLSPLNDWGTINISILYAQAQITAAHAEFVTDQSGHNCIDFTLTVKNALPSEYNIRFDYSITFYDHNMNAVRTYSVQNVLLNGNSTIIVEPTNPINIEGTGINPSRGGYFTAHTNPTAMYSYRFQKDSDWGMTPISDRPPRI